MNQDRTELFRLARQDRRSLGLIVILAITGAVITCVQMSNLSKVIASLVLDSGSSINLSGPLLWLAGAVLVRAAILGGNELVGQRLAAAMKQHLRSAVVRSIVSRGPLFAQNEKTGELATCCGEGIEKLDAWFSKYLPHSLGLACVPPVLVLYTASIDWLSALVFALTAPLIVVFMVLIGLAAQHRTKRQWVALSRMGGHFLDVLQGLPTLHLLGRSGVQGAQIRQVSEDFRHTTLQVLKIAFLSGFVLELAASLSTALVAVEIGVRLVSGQISFSSGLLVLLLAPEFYFPFRQFGASHHAGMEGSAAAERIFSLLRNRADAPASSTRNLWFSEPRTTPEKGELPCLVKALRFEQVSYRYPGCETMALADVSFELKPGQTYLFVGESGAGKSTVCKLLLRFIDPASGRITLNGVPLQQFPAEEWRAQIAAAVQQPHFFAGTILENIRAGRPDATLAEVREAARLAEADWFIRALPLGYDTQVTEAGNRFSGGQRQRLAIARALVRNCSVLLLDEPTSHLDRETAIRLLKNIRRLAQDRIIVLVAHQRDAVSSADAVFRLSAGRLVEATGIQRTGPTKSSRSEPVDRVLMPL